MRTVVTDAVKRWLNRQKWEGSSASSYQPHRSVLGVRSCQVAAAAAAPPPAPSPTMRGEEERGARGRGGKKSRVTADMQRQSRHR